MSPNLFFFKFQLDLPAIKGHYQQLYGLPLKNAVEKETSGDYRKTLIRIIDKVGLEKPKQKEPPKLKEPPKQKEPQKAEKERPKSAQKVVVVQEKPVQAKHDQKENKEQKKEKEAKKEEQEQKQEGKEKKKEDEDKINENDEDAVKLYKAMKGLGTKEDVIIEVITRNSNSERQTLKKRYDELYKKVN